MANCVSKIFRTLLGGLAALLLLPIYFGGWIVYGIVLCVRDFRAFASDFIRSMADADYLPLIGLSGCWTLQANHRKAVEADAEERYEEALMHWKKCACFFDRHAMVKVAEHLELSSDDEENAQKAAAEWYALAAAFGNAAAEEKYTSITGVTLEEKEKQWIRRSFIKYRKKYFEK